MNSFLSEMCLNTYVKVADNKSFIDFECWNTRNRLY